ncbi:methyltransferase [Asticcacaulis sp. AC460]|uniref:class I SAM-dependent methyltransferase n=1 Tax=Asticcacaulis sp. AC460 TaxID=1282360 RepID=UPI0003C40592|nr:class I SAM-dependent methyltransferase [Asticcacaulis sp. AC460]ESQ87331.1 methyltransferase [Asticcacaulis sp. AC460]
MTLLAGVDRRRMMNAGLGLGCAVMLGGLPGCGRKDPESEIIPDGTEGEEVIDPKLARQEGTIEWAVVGSWRSTTDKARDKFRHPIALLNFFEVRPKHTVVDMWPGFGYMSEILAPYLTHGKGRYVAALFEKAKADQAQGALNEKYRERFSSNKKLYGAVDFTEFGPDSGALVPAGTADCVLMLLVIQDWMIRGSVEKAFEDAFAALKPGGILGVEQHRADIGAAQEPAGAQGYVQEPFVRQLAAEAGFQFVKASEINANPKDDKDHPFGVWTLPPYRQTAERGQPPNPEFDGALYESIGESDRMTLKFRKPQ